MFLTLSVGLPLSTCFLSVCSCVCRTCICVSMCLSFLLPFFLPYIFCYFSICMHHLLHWYCSSHSAPKYGTCNTKLFLSNRNPPFFKKNQVQLCSPWSLDCKPAGLTDTVGLDLQGIIASSPTQWQGHSPFEAHETPAQAQAPGFSVLPRNEHCGEMVKACWLAGPKQHAT